MSTKVDSSNNVEFGTSAQLLPMQCCVQYGDCLDHLSNMSDDFVDYTITSPPYNVGTVKAKSNFLTKSLGNVAAFNSVISLPLCFLCLKILSNVP